MLNGLLKLINNIVNTIRAGCSSVWGLVFLVEVSLRGIPSPLQELEGSDLNFQLNNNSNIDQGLAHVIFF